MPTLSDPNAQKSTLTATPAYLLADGKNQSVLTLTLVNADGAPLPGKTVSFTRMPENRVETSAVIDKDGIYMATIKASHDGGFPLVTLGVIVDGLTLEGISTTVQLYSPPTITGLKISVSGEKKVGSLLTAKYDIALNGATKDVSTFQWQHRHSGAFVDIEGATGREFTPTSEFAGEQIHVKVTPEGEVPKEGGGIQTVSSDATVTSGPVKLADKPAEMLPPSVSNVRIEGAPMEGQTLKAKYDYEGHGEGGNYSYVVWERSGSNDSPWEEITRRVETFTPGKNDVGNYIRITVIPEKTAKTGVSSTAVKVQAKPVPTVDNVRIIGTPKFGETLRVVYDFYGYEHKRDAYIISIDWRGPHNYFLTESGDENIRLSRQMANGRTLDVGDGIYVQVFVKYGGRDVASGSSEYLKIEGDNNEIQDNPTLKEVSVNGYSFAVNAGFPTTGFQNAQFKLVLNGAAASDFNWRSGASWVSVSNEGEVKFIAEGNKTKVTITATPKSGGAPLSYSFSLKTWFNSTILALMEWQQANDPSDFSIKLPGYTLPSVEQLTHISKDPKDIVEHLENHVPLSRRGSLGSLWSEWGSIGKYKHPGYISGLQWTSTSYEQGGLLAHKTVNLDSGAVGGYQDGGRYSAFWCKSL